MGYVDYLKAYADDLSYNLSNGLEYINSTTAATPYFNSKSDAEAYIKRVAEAAQDVSLVSDSEVFRVLDALLETAIRTTDTDNVYNDETGESLTMEHVVDVYCRFKLRAGIED